MTESRLSDARPALGDATCIDLERLYAESSVAEVLSELDAELVGLAPVKTRVREIAEPRFAEGYDGVLVGHFHHPYERRENGKEFFVLGDWMEHFTYAELEGGHLTLRTWPAPA